MPSTYELIALAGALTSAIERAQTDPDITPEELQALLEEEDRLLGEDGPEKLEALFYVREGLEAKAAMLKEQEAAIAAYRKRLEGEVERVDVMAGALAGAILPEEDKTVRLGNGVGVAPPLESKGSLKTPPENEAKDAPKPFRKMKWVWNTTELGKALDAGGAVPEGVRREPGPAKARYYRPRTEG